MKLRRLLALLLFSVAALSLVGAGDPPPVRASSQIESNLSEAFSRRLQAAPASQALTFDLFTPELDSAYTTADGKTAVLWIALRDDSGRRLATEPGLALALLSTDGWQVLLPGDPGWEETLANLPEGMLPLEQSPAPGNRAASLTAVASPLTGYYLPYAAGTMHWLEGSISHFQYIPALGYPSCAIDYCHYAYDFTDQWHFPLLASKGGTVYASRDTCSDGDSGCTNFIVLYNDTDHAYQIYLHLSHWTIPDKLAPGTAVLRGQYLGDTDDTGYSTSQHVHFMVTNSIWSGGDGYYWGQSIDIRFADVSINQGIPRNCYEVTHFAIYDEATDCLGDKLNPGNPANDWFTSGNVGAFPPTGLLTRPAAGVTVNSGIDTIMDVTARVSDDVSVTAVRMVAKVNNQWTEIGPKVTQPAQPGLYDWDVDLCAAGPFNGPLEVAVRAWDYEGNVSPALDPHTIQVDHACPPPTSQLKAVEDFNSTAVRLSWDAASAGAGLGSFELQWRTEPGTWNTDNVLKASGSQRSIWFAGQQGSQYAFRLRALDINGQPEPWPAGDVAESTSTALPATCTPDTFEPDDGLAQAKGLALGVWAARNLCPLGNPDWFRIDIAADGTYYFRGASLNGGAAVIITVFDKEGKTIVASAKAAALGEDAFTIIPLKAGSYTLEVKPFVDNLSGTDALYRLVVSATKPIYIPKIAR